MDVISKLAKEAGNIIIGRDWIVTVCQGDRAKLARLNVWLTRTDELFGIVAPLAISFLRQVSGFTVAVFINDFMSPQK